MKLKMEELRFRNLAKSKAYRDAVAVRGESEKLRRKRVIIAPDLTTARERSVDTLSQTGLKSSRVPPLKPEHRSTEPVTADPEDSKLSSYRNWIEQRKTMRKDLNNCGKLDDWLDRKPSLSEVEHRVYINVRERLDKSHLTKHRGSNSDGTRNEDMHGDSQNQPSIKQPLPDILATISEYLAKKRLRMYDIFVQADKDKDWKITKKEFLDAMQVAGIPINNVEVEQLISALDQNNDDELEYKELAQGRDLFVLSERAKKHSELDFPSIQADSTYSFGTLQDTEPRPIPPTEKPFLPPQRQTTSPLLLSLPDTTSSEILPMDNLDKEKRLKRQKRKEKHRNRSKGSENIRQPCTMGENTGLIVDKFQKQRQKEYEAILELCHLYGVQFSKSMLARVLLHPEDRPTDVCISSLKPSSKYLLSEQALFRRLAPAASETHEKRRYSGENRRKSSLYSYNYVYPPAASVTPKVERMNLSSGTANISTKTVCWMTYEEYIKLTRHLDSRFEKSWKPTDVDDYWPSYVLDKVRLYLDQPKSQIRSENSIFDIVHNKTIH